MRVQSTPELGTGRESTPSRPGAQSGGGSAQGNGMRATRQMTKLATSLISGGSLGLGVDGMSANVRSMLQSGFVLDTGLQSDAQLVAEMPSHDFLQHHHAEMAALTKSLPLLEAEARQQELRAHSVPNELAKENQRAGVPRPGHGNSGAAALRDQIVRLADEFDALRSQAADKAAAHAELQQQMGESSEGLIGGELANRYSNARIHALREMYARIEHACERQDDEAAMLRFMLERLQRNTRDEGDRIEVLRAQGGQLAKECDRMREAQAAMSTMQRKVMDAAHRFSSSLKAERGARRRELHARRREVVRCERAAEARRLKAEQMRKRVSGRPVEDPDAVRARNEADKAQRSRRTLAHKLPCSCPACTVALALTIALHACPHACCPPSRSQDNGDARGQAQSVALGVLSLGGPAPARGSAGGA